MSKGFEELKKRYQRARAMSSRELADRVRQRTIARLDFLRYRANVGFEPRLAEGDSARPDPHFFFSADAIPLLCSRLRQLLPDEVNDIIERAERISAHRFDLLGYTDLHYGSEIDWHCDSVHGKRAPRKPWFKIRYLEFAEVGDSKVTWELNRHQHLVTLAKAFRLSGDGKFAEELFRQWKHWHNENPYPIGINWVSSLEVAFRSLSWLWVYFLMSGSSAMPAEFRSDLGRKLAVSARHIECYLSTYFSPNTHLIGEAAALFFIGTLCPQLPHAKRWQRRGWTILQQEADRQVRSDGLHFEQSTYYHVYALDFFLHAYVLASLNGISIPVQFERKLVTMLDVLCILGRSGSVPSLGDDDGGRLFDPQRNLSAYLLDPLATGAALFHRSDFKTVAGGLREETLWLLGETGMAEFDRLPNGPLPRNSAAFRSSGLYVMSDDNLERQLTIDAGPQGADTAGHGHADALSIAANSCGRGLLIDPGTFEYVGESSDRNRFRGSKAHNTMVVDGLDQSEPKGPFSWGSLPNVQAEKWIEGQTFDFFVGSHDGYMRLADPVVHRRSVFSLKSRFWLVRDQALGDVEHRLDLFWHVNPELAPIDEAKTTFRGERTGLSILAPENHGWSDDIMRDDWSPAYGRKEHHCVLHFGTVAKLPAEFATLLLPGASIPASNRFERTSSPSGDSSPVCYHVKTREEDHYIVYGLGKPWTMFRWSSDAELLYWGQTHDKTRRTLSCCNASFVTVDGQKIVSSQLPVLRCEIISVAGEVNVVSSDHKTLVSKEAFGRIFVEENGN